MRGHPEAEPRVPVRLRHPTVHDGPAMWKLANESRVLEPNSCYAYLLLATHFADTCAIAENGQGAVGFVAAYRPPTRPCALFVWQIGVDAQLRQQGVGRRLISFLLDEPVCHDIEYLEATIGVSNRASRKLFEGIARDREVRCAMQEGFETAHFGPSGHEAEPLFRVGPLRGKEP